MNSLVRVGLAKCSSVHAIHPLYSRQFSNVSRNSVYRALVGNSIITTLKLGVWLQTGSSAMFAEFIHTLADVGNQSLLYKGLRDSEKQADKYYQYGYGRAYFFWALISALGMFCSGAGVSVFHGIHGLISSSPHSLEVSSTLWSVLATSFLMDGFVLYKTISEINETKPKNIPLLTHLKQIDDPILLAILLEDAAACTGIIIASGGILLSEHFHTVTFDSLASVGVGGLLAFISLRLVKLNQQFLLGHSVDRNITDSISNLLMNRKGVEYVSSIKSQWLGPDSFSYKAEIDFDGTYLYINLRDKYLDLFLKTKSRQDMEVLMSFYAEDVTRMVEKEVRNCENMIKKQFPECKVIELEPDSKHHSTIKLPNQTDNLEQTFRKEFDEIYRLRK